MNIVSYGKVAGIIDHRKITEETQQKNSVYEILVEWENQFENQTQEQEEQYSWRPFTQIYKDVPQMVQEYFSLKKLSLESILKEEVEAREKHRN
jgi:predicted transcriptional regulator